MKGPDPKSQSKLEHFELGVSDSEDCAPQAAWQRPGTHSPKISVVAGIVGPQVKPPSQPGGPSCAASDQHPANVLGKAVGEALGTQVPVIHVGDPEGVLGSWLLQHINGSDISKGKISLSLSNTWVSSKGNENLLVTSVKLRDGGEGST